MYIVGIKRRFWFGFKKYVVNRAFVRGYTTLYAADGTQFEGPIHPYLVLEMRDEKEMYISDIEHRDWYSKEIK